MNTFFCDDSVWSKSKNTSQKIQIPCTCISRCEGFRDGLIYFSRLEPDFKSETNIFSFPMNKNRQEVSVAVLLQNIIIEFHNERNTVIHRC